MKRSETRNKFIERCLTEQVTTADTLLAVIPFPNQRIAKQLFCTLTTRNLKQFTYLRAGYRSSKDSVHAYEHTEQLKNIFPTTGSMRNIVIASDLNDY